MTETDSTKRPLHMPAKFIPYLERHRIYKLFKDMVKDLVLNLPKDHIKHMKVYLNRNRINTKTVDRVILLAEPNLPIDIVALAKHIIKDLGCFVITRRCVMDHYEKHDEYKPGCVSPVLMSEVTKALTLKEPVPQAGWLMFGDRQVKEYPEGMYSLICHYTDHPCTVREARCLQQDGVLPSVTLVLMNPPPTAPPPQDDLTPPRNFFQQDFEGLKYAYKATLKEVHINPDEDLERIASRCFAAVYACEVGAQGPGQGVHVVGSPGVYRVLLIGPRGAGCRTQGRVLAKHFGLVYLVFSQIFDEARAKDNDLGRRIRAYGTNIHVRAEAVKQRLLKKDCLDHGWVMAGYPSCGIDFEFLDNMPTPPNRIIFLSADIAVCKERLVTMGIDWCTGKRAPLGGARVLKDPKRDEDDIDNELDYYYSEALAELRAAAGLSAEEIDANQPFDKVQVKIQAAVIATPYYATQVGAPLRNVCGD